jgi:uncharacterized protein YkwD
LASLEKKMVDLVNGERAKVGLGALTIDSKLTEVARAKSQDMIDNNYFSHTSPTYGSPFDMMKAFGVTYRARREHRDEFLHGNAHVALMNSKAQVNILNPLHQDRHRIKKDSADITTYPSSLSVIILFIY